MAKFDFPRKLAFLLGEQSRYKVAYGGRGSGKSWAAARALLILGGRSKERILCTREVQKSIKDSVHKLLSDQILAMGMEAFYEVQETVIKGKNGTEFLFSGLANQTATSIKSLEGCTYVWCEEAQTISKKSWDILVPTIRAENSEIWVTFNPELETDETFQRFIVNPPTDCISIHINYNDNPFFPHVLEQERIHCQERNPEDYENIWEGKCRAAVQGAIYASEVATAQIDNRICSLPYDPAMKVHTVWDLGFADDMVIIMCQRARSEIRVIDYIQVNYTTTDKCASLLHQRPYNWGYDFLPHDGFSKERKMGVSDAEILARFGRRVKRVPKTSDEARIKIARSVFHRVAFDKMKAAQLLECLKRYRRSENIHGADTSPIHDEFCLPAGEMVSTKWGPRQIEYVKVGDEVCLPGREYGKVIKSAQTRTTNSLVEITCADGKILRCTPNHKVLTHKGIVLAESLCYNDSILKGGGMLWSILKLYSKVAHIGLLETITLAMTSGNKNQDTYTGTSGDRHLVTFLKGCTSTTSTIINSTTIYPTSPYSLSQSIVDITGVQTSGNTVSAILPRYFPQLENSQMSLEDSQKIERKTQRDGRPIPSSMNGSVLRVLWMRLVGRKLRPKSGTVPLKALHGIVSTGKEHGTTENLLPKCVLFAVKNILRFTPLVQSSATRIVKLRHYDVDALPVYNITVESHHCYLANGLLVSNSHGADAFGYMCQSINEMAGEDDYEQPRFEAFVPLSPTMGF